MFCSIVVYVFIKQSSSNCFMDKLVVASVGYYYILGTPNLRNVFMSSHSLMCFFYFLASLSKGEPLYIFLN